MRSYKLLLVWGLFVRILGAAAVVIVCGLVDLSMALVRMAYDLRLTGATIVDNLTHSFVRVVVAHRRRIIILIREGLLGSSSNVVVDALFLIFERAAVVVARAMTRAGVSMRSSISIRLVLVAGVIQWLLQSVVVRVISLNDGGLVALRSRVA